MVCVPCHAPPYPPPCHAPPHPPPQDELAKEGEDESEEEDEEWDGLDEDGEEDGDEADEKAKEEEDTEYLKRLEQVGGQGRAGQGDLKTEGAGEGRPGGPQNGGGSRVPRPFPPSPISHTHCPCPPPLPPHHMHTLPPPPPVQEARDLIKGHEEDSDDEFTDDEEVESPLDPIDPFVAFADSLGALQRAMPDRYSLLVSGADAGTQAALQGMVAFAEHQRQELAKAAAEEAAKAAKP